MTTTFDTYTCPSPTCDTDELLVRAVRGHPNTWQVTSHPEGNGWIIAALDPCCPFCGTTLIQELDAMLTDPEKADATSH